MVGASMEDTCWLVVKTVFKGWLDFVIEGMPEVVLEI